MKLFIDGKEFPHEVKNMTYKRHYVGALPRGWDCQIRCEDGDGESLYLVYVISIAVGGKNNCYLCTPNDLEWLLTRNNELSETVEMKK